MGDPKDDSVWIVSDRERAAKAASSESLLLLLFTVSFR